MRPCRSNARRPAWRSWWCRPSAARRRWRGLDHVVDGLGDVGGVIAHALDVLGAEQQVDAEGDVARILHHVGQELAEQRGAHGVDLLVAAPHLHRLAESRAGIGVEHLLELRSTSVAICSTPRISLRGMKLASSASTRLAMFLARSPIRSRSLDTRSAPTIRADRPPSAAGGRSSAPRAPRSPLQRVDARIVGDGALGGSASRRRSASTASAICFSASPPSPPPSG